MIIWLASYPKSGNTWVRSIVSSLIYSQSGDFNFNLLKNIKQYPQKKYFKDEVSDFGDFDKIKSNWILIQNKINLDKEIKFFKTHQGNYTVGGDSFTNKANTKAVIYIVRDPRNVVSSISNHFSLSLEKSLDFMMSPKIIGNTKKFEENGKGILTLLGKWNEHYSSWTKKVENVLIIKYEDLLLAPILELNKIILFLKKFINFHTNENKNNNILRNTSFENLKKLEDLHSFEEAALDKITKSKINFFNLGPKNNWESAVDEKIVKIIEKEFYKEMKELGYLK